MVEASVAQRSLGSGTKAWWAELVSTLCWAREAGWRRSPYLAMVFLFKLRK